MAASYLHTIREIWQQIPLLHRLLIPDLRATWPPSRVMDAPRILNHNTEPRLYRTVRPQANYQQTLMVLSNARF
jgi:lipoic acid synthetase